MLASQLNIVPVLSSVERAVLQYMVVMNTNYLIGWIQFLQKTHVIFVSGVHLHLLLMFKGYILVTAMLCDPLKSLFLVLVMGHYSLHVHDLAYN